MKNKEHFTKLIESIENDLYNIAEKKLNNKNDIDDIIQETIIKIYKNYDNLNNKKYFKSWAIKILLNECNKSYNKKHKEALLINKIISKENLNLEDTSLSLLESNWNFKALLKNLSITDQDIFIFYYLCDYSTKAISKILQLNESTIRSKIQRNKKKLKQILKSSYSNENIK